MKKISYIIIFVLFFCCNIHLATAQVIQIVTLDQALDLAIKNNPKLNATHARLGVNEAQIWTANTRLNPALVTDNGVAESTYRVGIEQIFELGGKRKKRVALVQAQKEAVMSEINTAILDLRQNVRNSYIQLYNAQQKIKAANDILKTTEKLSEIARKRQLAGAIANLDVIQTELIKINAKNDLQRAKLELVQALNNLNNFVGKPIDEASELAPPNLLAQFSDSKSTKEERTNEINKLIGQAYINRPELKTIVQNINIASRQMDIAKANRIPNVILAAGPDIVTGDEGKINVFVTGSMEIPVFNRQQGAIRESVAQRNLAEKELESTKSKIELEIKNAFSRIVSDTETIKIYESELLPKASEVIEKSRRSFEEGKSDILVPLTAQQSYINTKLGYIQALTDYQNAVSDLERAIGVGL